MNGWLKRAFGVLAVVICLATGAQAAGAGGSDVALLDSGAAPAVKCC